MNSIPTEDRFLIEVESSDDVWRTLQEIAKGSMMEQCEFMIEKGATKDEIRSTA